MGGLFFSSFLSKTFSLLHFAPPPPPRLLCAPPPRARGNGRLLGRRSKRRNCLRVQSSKKASSIWRDRVRRALRPLPCPPAAASAAPASCRGDPEPWPAGVSCRARTPTHAHTHLHTHTLPPQLHAPASVRPPGRQLLVLGLLCCSRCGHSRFVCPWVSLCGLCVRGRGAQWRSSAPTPLAPGPGSSFPGAGCTRGESRR